MKKHRQHRFAGQDEGNALAEWLNRWRNKKPGRVVLQLLKDHALLERAKKDARSAFAKLVARKAAQAKSSLSRKATVRVSDFPSDTVREHAKIARRIGRALSQCSVRPQLLNDGTGIALGWNYKSPVSAGAFLFASVVQKGYLDRLKPCANAKCRAWFFAKGTQPLEAKYCSEVCRRRVYQRSEKWKAKRRQNYQFKFRKGSKPRSAAPRAKV